MQRPPTTILIGLAMSALAVILLGWALFPHLTTSGRLLTTAYLTTMLSAIALRGTRFIVWPIGILAVLTPAALLLLGHAFTTGDEQQGLKGLLFLYCAGMVGGLVLELLQEKRYVLEKPSMDNDEQDHEGDTIRRPGQKWNLGVLSRLLVGGLAGAILVTLIGSLLGNITITSATEPSALVWAVVAGSAAPAVWKQLNDTIAKRNNTVDELLTALEKKPDQQADDPLTAGVVKAIRNLI